MMKLKVKEKPLSPKDATTLGTGGKHAPRVLAVTSGKGGVGKSNIAGNLAVAFARMGRRVLLWDGDLGLANLDVLFGLNPKKTIEEVLSGRLELKDVIMRGPENISIIPAGSGLLELTRLGYGQRMHLLAAFEDLEHDYDIFLIDTGAGISDTIAYFNAGATDRLVLSTPEPTAITDAYALMKVMGTRFGVRRFLLAVNMVTGESEARRVYRTLSDAMLKHLKNISLTYMGGVPRDPHLEKAVRQQKPLIKAYPESPAALAVISLARALLSIKTTPADGNIKFFLRRLMERGKGEIGARPAAPGI